MVDLQKLLLGVATEALAGGLRSPRHSYQRRSRRSNRALGQGKLIMGLLGVAVAAYEHYTQKSETSSSPRSPERGVPPPPPPPTKAPPNDHALLLLRIMIAAAHADGTFDNNERTAIIGQLQKGELSTEEKSFLEKEFSSPQDLRTLCAFVTSAQQAEQAYSAAVLVIDVDSQAEDDFLRELGQRLEISRERQEALVAQVELS